MPEHTPLGTESTMNLATARKYSSAYSKSGSGLGSEITKTMREPYDGYDAGKSIRSVFMSCDTPEEWSLADDMFYALTGFTIHEITASTNPDPYAYVMPCGWHDKKSDDFPNMEARKEFYFKGRNAEDLSDLGAAALTAGGFEDETYIENAYLNTFQSVSTDREAQICDAVSIAVSGWSFESLLDMCCCPYEKKEPPKKEAQPKTR